jgi:glycosyltransferase involved in cell wall biosynthesis
MGTNRVVEGKRLCTRTVRGGALRMADVSVVIATHNRSSLVKQAIDSVLAQSEPVREVIIVDDGSTDDTLEELAAYGDRIRVFSQKQAGPSAARNRAIREAVGEWIGFLDDDDVWLPIKIEKQMQLVRQNPQVGLVYCSDYAVDETLQILYTRAAQPANRGDVFDRLLIKNFMFTSCVLARREGVEAAGYMDPQLRFAQDWDLWLKMAAKNPIEFAPEPLVLYRQAASGCLTRDIDVTQRLGEMELILNRALRLRRTAYSTRCTARCELELQWAATWLACGRNTQALVHSLRAVSLRPFSSHAVRLLLYSLMPRHTREWGKKILHRSVAKQTPNT